MMPLMQTSAARLSPKVNSLLSCVHAYKHVNISCSMDPGLDLGSTSISTKVGAANPKSGSAKKKLPTPRKISQRNITKLSKITTPAPSKRARTNEPHNIVSKNKEASLASSASSTTPTKSSKVILSLREEPYKSILSAHFRLFGPERFLGGSDVEKVVGERIMDRILSGGYEGVAGEVRMYKLFRSGNGVEEVSHSVALRSEFS